MFFFKDIIISLLNLQNDKLAIYKGVKIYVQIIIVG